jgi:hypothetical protein
LAARRRPLWALMIAICIPCCGESDESGRGGERRRERKNIQVEVPCALLSGPEHTPPLAWVRPGVSSRCRLSKLEASRTKSICF